MKNSFSFFNFYLLTPMKYHFFILPVALLSFCTSLCLGADSAVSEALGKTTSIIKGSKSTPTPPKAEAKYYILLYSASWCGPCCAEMPNVVKMYKKDIKRNPDLELIHISADKTDEDALQWAKSEKVPFPVILPKDKISHPITSQSTSGGIPRMVIVDAEGKKVMEGHPSKLLPLIKDIAKDLKAGKEPSFEQKDKDNKKDKE